MVSMGVEAILTVTDSETGMTRKSALGYQIISLIPTKVKASSA